MALLPSGHSVADATRTSAEKALILARLSKDNLTQGNVTIETSLGKFEIELYWQHAPMTCRNFYELSRWGYYDNSAIHRVVRDFVVQMGDPTGEGTGGESIYGKFMVDEIDSNLRHTGAGVVSMANTGEKDTNGSQFYVTLAPAPFLDGKNTIFGRIKAGLDVIEALGQVATVIKTGRPQASIKVIKAVVGRTD